MKTVHLVAAARPNFMKVAPLWHALQGEKGVRCLLVHTGQHYDEAMCAALFRDLALPQPDICLEIGSGTHAQQTGGVMMAYEAVLLKDRPDLVVVVGDVNATPGAAMAAVKLGIPVAHLEAGLRSGDRTMPEEINRKVTDAMGDWLWTPSPDADEHLLREGVSPDRIIRVGNIMIDALVMLRPKIDASHILSDLNLDAGAFGVVTLHRPSNVDALAPLRAMCEALIRVARDMPMVFPVHPRTRARLTDFRLMPVLEACPHIIMTEALSYIPFMRLVSSAAWVLTDSGGVQEETTFLGIPCVTLRDSTERPITISEGTNQLSAPDGIEAALLNLRTRERKAPPALWDGQTAFRIRDSIRRILSL